MIGKTPAGNSTCKRSDKIMKISSYMKTGKCTRFFYKNVRRQPMNRKPRIYAAGLALLSLFILSAGLRSDCFASSEYKLSTGQTLYVPVYSNIFSAPKQVPFNLATILSIRNTDISNSIKIIAADYYDTKGRLVKKYYDKAITLAPLESTYIYLPEDDTAGGFGANFIVTWAASREVNAPIIECLMIGMRGGQGISFISPGQAIKKNTK
jgi:hypothetical protein